MREIVLVNKIIFEFRGSIAKRAFVVGDADNDQRNELVCANLQGDLAVFKDKNSQPYAHASDLGMVTACLIGDVINSGKNYVTAINTEGWLFIFELLSPDSPSEPSSPSILIDSDRIDPSELETNADFNCDPKKPTSIPLTLLYTQRVPANCKELLIADLDGDGQYEIIIGLTDRVLRTYRWVQIGPDRGKFVGLYKWEFADQIGSVSLNTSRHRGCQDIIVAQPGGTYAKLECFDKTTETLQAVKSSHDSKSGSPSPTTIGGDTREAASEENVNDDNKITGGVKTEYISKLTPEYHQPALSQMRNHHVSTEVLGGVRESKDADCCSLIVLATLDGTLMLVHKDQILWSLQVDHQLFALAMLETRPHRQSLLSQSESTCTIVPNLNIDRSKYVQQNCFRRQAASGNCRKTQYFVVCAWDGKTYIVDEERNYLRFKFDEAVSAFAAGNYYFDGRHHPSLIYATFNNQVILYNDVIMDSIRPMYLMEELFKNPEYTEFCNKLEKFAEQLGMFNDAESDDLTSEQGGCFSSDVSQKQARPGEPSSPSVRSEVLKRRVLRKLIDEILCSVTEDELMESANKK